MRDMFRILDKEKRGEVNTDELRSASFSLLFTHVLVHVASRFSAGPENWFEKSKRNLKSPILSFSVFIGCAIYNTNYIECHILIVIFEFCVLTLRRPLNTNDVTERMVYTAIGCCFWVLIILRLVFFFLHTLKPKNLSKTFKNLKT